jgi:hypothetical protein
MTGTFDVNRAQGPTPLETCLRTRKTPPSFARMRGLVETAVTASDRHRYRIWQPVSFPSIRTDTVMDENRPRPKGTTLSDQLKTISSPANAMEARPMNVRPPRTARVKSDM